MNMTRDTRLFSLSSGKESPASVSTTPAIALRAPGLLRMCLREGAHRRSVRHRTDRDRQSAQNHWGHVMLARPCPCRGEIAMLYEFLRKNRPELIERCRIRVANRRAPIVTPAELSHGVPLFLDQLTEMLPGGRYAEVDHHPSPVEGRSKAERRLEDSATAHGRELLRHDFTIEQVVHDYGDLCQAITELAAEQAAPIDNKEFGILNIKLDNAIAGAVTEYARKNGNHDATSQASLSTLVHELRNLHNTSIVALTALRQGRVGLTGATAAALDHSMGRIGTLLDRAISMTDAT